MVKYKIPKEIEENIDTIINTQESRQAGSCLSKICRGGRVMDFPEEMKQERRWCAWFYHDDPQHPDDTHKRQQLERYMRGY